jgi:hypothetical protein
MLTNKLSRAKIGTSPIVSIDLPQALSERVMNALKADPRTVDLRALVPHFYSFGVRILDLFDEEEIVDILSDVRPLIPELMTAFENSLVLLTNS